MMSRDAARDTARWPYATVETKTLPCTTLQRTDRGAGWCRKDGGTSDCLTLTEPEIAEGLVYALSELEEAQRRVEALRLFQRAVALLG